METISEKNKAEHIKILDDDDQYYGDYGKNFLSNSDIGALINNPQSFHQPQEDNINFLYGRAFHELLMFGETKHSQHVDASTRTTKIYKEASAEAGQILFLTKEWDELNRLVDSTFKNKAAADILNTKGNQYEVPNVGILTSEMISWKCKADILTDDFIIDIKTSSSINGFKYSSRTYNYDSQSYIYSTMFQKPMRFLVVEKGTGNVAIYDVSDEAYQNGYEKVEKAEANYLKYFANKEEKLQNFVVYGEI